VGEPQGCWLEKKLMPDRTLPIPTLSRCPRRVVDGRESPSQRAVGCSHRLDLSPHQALSKGLPVRHLTASRSDERRIGWVDEGTCHPYPDEGGLGAGVGVGTGGSADRTRAVPVEKLMTGLVRWGLRRRTASILAAHDPHDIPPTMNCPRGRPAPRRRSPHRQSPTLTSSFHWQWRRRRGLPGYLRSLGEHRRPQMPSVCRGELPLRDGAGLSLGQKWNG